MSAIDTPSSPHPTATGIPSAEWPLPEGASGYLTFGSYRLFANLRRLERAGHAVELGSRAFDILCILTEHAGEIVTQRDLMRSVWGKVMVGEGSLRFHINELRKTLAQGGATTHIKNVARRGYVFVAPVHKVVVDHSEDTWSRVFGRLPRRPAQIVGRESDLQEIITLLGQTRFVTVVGAAGLGKSTVAVELGYRLRERFDLVKFVDFEPIQDAAWAASAVASALGLIVSSANPVSSLVAYLREKRVLLIFDSCERVLESVAMLAEQIFDGSTRSAILATSQEALRADGEHAYTLDPLQAPADDPQLTAEEALRYPAIELFVARARETIAHFQLSASNVATIVAICRRVDGIPLAIELAAGRAGTLALPNILSLLNSQFALTWPGRRTAPERHRTLGAAIAWTVELLDEVERVLLRRLAVFSGPFKLEAAQQVTSGNGLPSRAVARALSNLAAKSLLCSSSLGGSPGSKQSTHFWLLGATHAFAIQMLEDSGDATWVGHRHAMYLCELFERVYAGSEFVNSESWRSPVAYLTNIRSALDWALRQPDEAELLARLAAAATPFLLDRSLLSECVRWASIGLKALRDRRGSVQELELQASLGLALLFSGGGLEDVQVALTRALELADEQRDPYNQVRVLGALNSFYQRNGDAQSALQLAERARNVAQPADDPALSAMADWLLGSSSHLAGKHAGACRLGERAWFSPPLTGRVKRARFGFDDHRIRALCGWARSLWMLGKADEARLAVPRVLREAERFGQPTALAVVLSWLTPVWVWAGDWETADEYLSRFRAHAEQFPLGIYRFVAQALQGELAIARGQAAVGLEALREALEALRRTRFRTFEVIYSPPLALALAQLGRPDDALIAIDTALEVDGGFGGSFVSPELLRVKGDLVAQLAGRKTEAAEALVRQSFEEARRQGALGWQLRSAMSLARLDRLSLPSKSAGTLLRQTYAQFSQGFETRDLILARQLLEELTTGA